MDAERVIGLPTRPFLYTLDQLEVILGMSPPQLRRELWLDRLQTGPQDLDKMKACNVSVEGKRVDWRVAEKELVRWCRRKGFKVVERYSVPK